MSERSNEGFTIIKSEYYSNRNEIVLAVMKAGNGNHIQYVTWECINETNYFWGHYFHCMCEDKAYEKALKDYHTRLAKAYDDKIN